MLKTWFKNLSTSGKLFSGSIVFAWITGLMASLNSTGLTLAGVFTTIVLAVAALGNVL